VAGFLVDENLPARLALELSSRGFRCEHVTDHPHLRGAPDHEIGGHAGREGLVLITKDRELAIASRYPEAHRTGVVSVRIRDELPIDEQIRIVVAAVTSLEAAEFRGSVVVGEPGRVRVRRGGARR